MNYSESEKVIDDMCPEVDALYNMAILLFDYITYKDLSIVDPVTNEPKYDVLDLRRTTLENLMYFIDTYKQCKKINVKNETIVKDRKFMEDFIKELQLKVVSEEFKLDQFLDII